MSRVIWNALNSGIIRYDLTYDVYRPNIEGTEVKLNYHLHVYRSSDSNYFNYPIRWDQMWTAGTNRVSREVKPNGQAKFDFWTDSGEFSVWTDKDYITGVRLIMTAPGNDGPSGWYDTGSDINIWCPPMEFYLDLNGRLDGNYSGNIAGWGTADVYINGSRNEAGVTDFYKRFPNGTSFEFKNINATTGHVYNGLHSGKLSGNINGLTYAELSFSTATYSNKVDNWAWGFRHQEGNNGDKSAFKLGQTSFNCKYNTKHTVDKSRGMTPYKGFYLDNKFGTSSIDGNWKKYNMGTQVTQKGYEHYYEFDYRPYTYNITYQLNGGSDPGNPSTYNVLYGVTFKNPTRADYNFKNWTIGGSAVTGINPGANATFSSSTDMKNKLNSRTIGDKTVVANWTIKNYPYNLNILLPDGSEPFKTGEAGDVECSINNGAYKRVHNEETNSYPMNTTFKFRNFIPGRGLKLSSVSGATAISDGWSLTLPSGGKTVIFKTAWETYSIEYNSDGGSITPSKQTVNYNSNITIASSAGTKPGYKFLGWYDPTGSSWTSWSGTWTYINGQYGITGNKLVLKAKWERTISIVRTKENNTWIKGEMYTKHQGHYIESSSVYTKENGHWVLNV